MRKRKFYSLLILFIFFLIVKTTQLIERNKTVETIKINKIEERENKKYSALVTKVIDGDTIKVKFLEPVPEELNIEETIRLIGINTPELNKHKSAPKEYFAQEAADFTNKCLNGKIVEIKTDKVSNLRDKYNRLVAYVYHEGFLFNKIIIEEGYASYYPNFKFENENMYTFQKAERYAKDNKKGKWKK